MGANTLQLKRTPIPDTILKRIYDSDQEMYPAPLTYERLKSWIDGCPELSICFETIPGEGTNTVPVGAVIVLPVVKMYWDDLVLGRLKETDIDAATMFPGGGGEVDVGLHVFHIERFDAGTRITKVRNFAQVALESVRDIVRKRAWNVIGHSGMSTHASPARLCPRANDINQSHKLLRQPLPVERPSREWTSNLPGTRSYF